MEQKILLSELFPNIELDAQFENVLVRSASVDRKGRKIVLELDSEVYITPDIVQAQADRLKESFALGELVIHMHYPKALLRELPSYVLYRQMCKTYSPAAAILACAKWEISEKGVQIHLAANGKAEIEPFLPQMQQYIEQQFGVRVPVEVHSNKELSAEELFERTRQLRAEALKNTPIAEPIYKEQKDTKKSLHKTENNMIFGKPFKVEPTLMKDLNLDMYRVCVQGKVFAVH